jgi:CRISPR/Cas system-associated endoribonuclease Cas2
MEVDLVLEDIRENKRERAVEFFQRRGIKVAAQGSVFESLLNSLSERLSETRVSNAINLLRITPRGDSEALGEALEAVKEAIGQ